MAVQTPKTHRVAIAKGGDGSFNVRDRRDLIDGLNEDLAAEYQSILMSVHYSAKMTGPYRRELRALFQLQMGEDLRHAHFLADKIAALGGEPTTQPVPVPHADDTRDVLEQLLLVKKQAIADHGERIRQAEAYKDIGLRVGLERQVADETRHKEELERILAGWNEQNRERVRNEDRWQDDGGQG